jgi:hypothetical protein
MTYILLRDGCHSQRLPFDRIQRADKLGEIDLKENPTAPGLRARNEAALGARPHFFRMHMQKRGRFMQVQGFEVTTAHADGPGASAI